MTLSLPPFVSLSSPPAPPKPRRVRQTQGMRVDHQSLVLCPDRAGGAVFSREHVGHRVPSPSSYHRPTLLSVLVSSHRIVRGWMYLLCVYVWSCRLRVFTFESIQTKGTETGLPIGRIVFFRFGGNLLASLSKIMAFRLRCNHPDTRIRSLKSVLTQSDVPTV